MGSRLIDRKKLAGFAAMGFMLAASGCQSGDTLGALNIGGGGSQPQQQPQAQVSAEELIAYCPAVTLQSANAIFRSYQGSAADDPARLSFQASIADATRTCSYQSGMLGMTIAAAGRVVPGPVGSTGNITLPIRLTVYQDTQEVFSQVINHQVAVADTIGATQFMFVDSSFSMPNPTSRNVRAYVGFDNAGE